MPIGVLLTIVTESGELPSATKVFVVVLVLRISKEDVPLVEFMYFHACQVRVTVGNSCLCCLLV